MTGYLSSLDAQGRAFNDQLDPSTKALSIPRLPDWNLRELVAHSAGHVITTTIEGGNQRPIRGPRQAPARQTSSSLSSVTPWSSY